MERARREGWAVQRWKRKDGRLPSSGMERQQGWKFGQLRARKRPRREGWVVQGSKGSKDGRLGISGIERR